MGRAPIPAAAAGPPTVLIEISLYFHEGSTQLTLPSSSTIYFVVYLADVLDVPGAVLGGEAICAFAHPVGCS